MTSHVPTDGGNPQSHIDGLAREGFPSILWEVLQGAGYTTPPKNASLAVGDEAPRSSSTYSEALSAP